MRGPAARRCGSGDPEYARRAAEGNAQTEADGRKPNERAGRAARQRSRADRAAESLLIGRSHFHLPSAGAFR